METSWTEVPGGTSSEAKQGHFLQAVELESLNKEREVTE